MLTKRIIACLDVKDGRVVKGVQFRDHVDMGDILELSQRYADEGVDELVFYDITASSDGRVVDEKLGEPNCPSDQYTVLCGWRNQISC